MTDLVAATYAPHHAGGTALGAAAVDKLAFTIPSSGQFPWIVVFVLGGIAVSVGTVYGVRRSRLRPGYPM